MVPEHLRDLRVQKRGRSLISAYRILAITASTSGFEKLSTALVMNIFFTCFLENHNKLTIFVFWTEI